MSDSEDDMALVVGEAEDDSEEEDDEEARDQDYYISAITEQLRKESSSESEFLELDIPSSYDWPITEELISRVADFVRDELKREVTHLRYRESVAGPMLFQAIRRVMSPSSLQLLTLNGRLGNDTAGILVRDVLGNRFTSLKEIQFYRAEISDGSIIRDMLENNPQLEILGLGVGNGPFSIMGIRLFSQGLSGAVQNSLKCLDVGNLRVLDGGFTMLCNGLLQSPALQKLTLQANGLTKASLPLATQLLQRLRALEEFRINVNPLLFKDAPLNEIKSFALAAASSQYLKDLSIQKCGLSGLAMAVVLGALASKSTALETLCIDLEDDETYKALEKCVPKFKALRSLQYLGGKLNAWEDSLSTAVLQNTSLYEIKCWSGVSPPPQTRGLFFHHFQSNRAIAKARDLLAANAKAAQNGSNMGLPLGVWPKAISALNETRISRGQGKTATFLILRSQLVTWIQQSHKDNEDKQDKTKSSSGRSERSPVLPIPDAAKGESSNEKPSKRQRLKDDE
ncbi:expressed unknown protein [Seminavis robusta]|uniref:Uncharacterized protein n=1 Tax=Seminavis robusta TaxID=568900 RepID=A0A9N8H8W0_9STRA|nr:expressed unknown protein [Seminavis robusta]|eukprot:Sro253_g100010.1 n/a (511) ;mRNA; r:71141-72673